MQIGAATMENGMKVPQKIKNRTPLWPRNSTYGYISKETQNTNSKENLYPYVHSSAIYKSQDMEATQLSINKWVDKETMVYTYNGILLNHNNKWNLNICDSMDGPKRYYAKWNKLEKDKHHILFISGKNKTNK